MSTPQTPPKHYVSNLKKPYFKPPNKHISNPQKTFILTPKNLFQTPNKPKSKCHNKKNYKHKSYQICKVHHIPSLKFKSENITPWVFH
jgi:hypothetical protein